MTEITTKDEINAVYKAAKLREMPVILAPSVAAKYDDHWCGMVDADSTAFDRPDLIDDDLWSKIEKNQCKLDSKTVSHWLMQTLYSVAAVKMNDDIQQLYSDTGLLIPHWIFSGIPRHSRGFLDDCLGIGAHQCWVCHTCL